MAATASATNGKARDPAIQHATAAPSTSAPPKISRIVLPSPTAISVSQSAVSVAHSAHSPRRSAGSSAGVVRNV